MKNKLKEEQIIEMQIQRRRHMSHTGPANKTRKPCIYCEQEKK